MNTRSTVIHLKADFRVLPPRWLYFAMFTVSGFSGLIYESIWSHYLKLFLGHAAFAQSLVLMIFMGGMAAGAWLASRFSARLRIPLLGYAIVEVLIGFMALGFHGVFEGMIDAFYFSILPNVNSPALGSALKWLAASALIIPQSILLGMTFPLMSAGILRRYPDTPGGSLAMLYFTNSIGAAVGVLASGFWLIALVGLPGTIFTAGLLNIVLALTVWVLIKLDPAPATAPIEIDAGSGVTDRTEVQTVFLVAAFVTGAASFIYEIGWIRMLSLVLGSTTHSFELMLSAFITGLAFGGLWIKRRIDRVTNPVNFSGWIQILMATAAIATLPVYAMSFDWMSGLMNTVRQNDAGFLAFTVGSHAIALAVMLPATFLAGMTLPLFTFVLMKQGVGEKAIGRIYSANTFGAIVGVMFAIHVGLPLLGLKKLIVFGAALDLILGIVLIARSTAARHSWQPALGAVLGCCAVAIAMTSVEFSPNRLVSGVYRSGRTDKAENAKVLYYRDGKTASISFSVFPDQMAVLATNGKPDASMYIGDTDKVGFDDITVVMAGSLPLAYKPDAKTVGNIGLGSGLTTHTLLASPAIDVVDTVEIEPAMVAGARGFGERVARTFFDPRSRIHIEDAKTFFSLHNRRYDIIVAEPSNPWVSGVSSLFSSEFYRMVRNYLPDDGLFVQWLQLYEFEDKLVFSVLKALSPHFEDYVIYNTDNVDILIVARKKGRLGRPDFGRVLSGQMADDLARVGIASEHDFLVRKTGQKDTIETMFGHYPVPANSDYFPYLDLHAGKARFKKQNAALMYEWAAAPLPMLEMLHDDELALDRTQTGRNFRRLEAIGAARSIYAELVSKDPDARSAPMPAELYWALQTVSLMRADCAISGDFEDKWENAWHPLAAGSLAFLDAGRAKALVDEAWAPACHRDSSPAATTRRRLYAAIAARDAAAMAKSGRDLLAIDEIANPRRLEYVVSATMLGLVASGRYAAAVDVWRTHGEAANLRAAPYTNLILQIALTRSR